MYTKSNRKSGSPSQKSGRRHISTSGLVSSALATLVFAVFGPVWPPYLRKPAGNASYEKIGCIRSQSVDRKWNSETETGSTFKSARNGRKCREIKYFPKNSRKMSSRSNRK